jgi:hypothetical protein
LEQQSRGAEDYVGMNEGQEGGSVWMVSVMKEKEEGMSG